MNPGMRLLFWKRWVWSSAFDVYLLPSPWMSLRATPAWDEARKRCPTPATSFCSVDIKNTVTLVFIYFFIKHQPNSNSHKFVPACRLKSGAPAARMSLSKAAV